MFWRRYNEASESDLSAPDEMTETAFLFYLLHATHSRGKWVDEKLLPIQTLPQLLELI